MRPSTNHRKAAPSSQAKRFSGLAPSGSQPASKGFLRGVFAGLFGAFLGLSLLKFGNPPIMEKWVSPPADVYEFLLGYPWPINWAYGLFIFVGVIGLFIARANRDGPRELKCGPLPPRPPSPG